MRCRICGEWHCKKHSLLLNNVTRTWEFSGSSPPEVFVGRWNYPNVYFGVLSPPEHGDTAHLSSYEIWHKKRYSSSYILSLRRRLIYARTQGNVKKLASNSWKSSKLVEGIRELAMSSRPTAGSYKLKKLPSANPEKEKSVPIIPQAAPLEALKLEENPKVERKVDYLAHDTDAKASNAMLELARASVPTSTIIKLLSVGLLGQGTRRKFVPTRWAITATDSTLSEKKIEKIKSYPEIQDFIVFSAEYLGNHYEFLLLPDKFAFEVIEISHRGGVWHDHEGIFKRKTYAASVTGAYYANRLALGEYLEKVKRQAACLVFREIKPSYEHSLGVGILRELSREAFARPPRKFASLTQALEHIRSKLQLPLEQFTSRSFLLRAFRTQTKILSFFPK
ncbi:hypothetical protein D6817_01990 [Candidatus Pacearchaeota archaeon]|nr:MAG: hypothetical protein D6817_01990 [Candidatus Pacearchaeota archaeon]